MHVGNVQIIGIHNDKILRPLTTHYKMDSFHILAYYKAMQIKYNQETAY
jgi:hypothetical protein